MSDLCLVLLTCPLTLYKILVIRWLLPPLQPLCVLSQLLPLLFRSEMLPTLAQEGKRGNSQWMDATLVIAKQSNYYYYYYYYYYY